MENASKSPQYASVILDVAIDKLLDYLVPDECMGRLKRGSRVEVPLRGGFQQGYVFALKDAPDFPHPKPIAKLIADDEHIIEELFELALWMSKYYCAPLRKVLKGILPASVRSNMKPKEQLFVMRAKTKEELKEYCEKTRGKHHAQAAILDVMLMVKKGILLTELLEQSGTSRSTVDGLVKKGKLSVDIMRIDRSPLINEDYFKTKAKILNSDQAEALKKIAATLDQKIFQTHLLFGVTGSGKTEVYLQAIEKVLKEGKSTIMLVPEISLTPQTIERFRSRFEGHIAVLHHRLSQGERFDEWQRIRRGDAKIVIGARSAIFSPVQNLGLIIVDEEHEAAYKQGEEVPCYNARDVAVMRGKINHAAVILGSATPSLESYYNAQQGKYLLSILSGRAGDSASIPTFHLVDMRKEYEKAKGFTTFSDLLLDKLKQRTACGEQTILLLNRRGYHTQLLCRACQHVIKCAHCDISLTFHLGESTLACHLCAFSIQPPQQCPICQSSETMKFRGIGTEQVEKALYAVLPAIRVIRVDADTTKHKGSHQKLLRDFATGKADVLLGTQMIAKGLHFPQVTLVGVLNCDAGLNIPDYRASETTFQLVTQVAGRAGRGVIPGEVIVQTSMPDNATIGHAAAQDYPSFYAEECRVRRLFDFPPCMQMVKLAFAGEDQLRTSAAAENMRRELQKSLSLSFLLNPVVPAGHAKVKDKYRFHFFVRGPNIYAINRAIEDAKAKLQLSSKIQMLIDVNPLSIFF